MTIGIRAVRAPAVRRPVRTHHPPPLLESSPPPPRFAANGRMYAYSHTHHHPLNHLSTITRFPPPLAKRYSLSLCSPSCSFPLALLPVLDPLLFLSPSPSFLTRPHPPRARRLSLFSFAHLVPFNPSMNSLRFSFQTFPSMRFLFSPPSPPLSPSVLSMHFPPPSALSSSFPPIFPCPTYLPLYLPTHAHNSFARSLASSLPPLPPYHPTRTKRRELYGGGIREDDLLLQRSLHLPM